MSRNQIALLLAVTGTALCLASFAVNSVLLAFVSGACLMAVPFVLLA